MDFKGITFTRESDGIQYHTFYDWGLVLKERPDPGPPEPKTEKLEIPGADYYLDLTEVLTGEVQYESRKISVRLGVIDRKDSWAEKYSMIMDYLHGRKMKIIMDDDPAYYYTGRVKVNSWASSANNAEIIIDCEMEPYKMELTSSLEDWLWDPFDLDYGIIREYGNMPVDGTMNFTIIGSRKPVTPVFLIHSEDGQGMTLKYNGESYHLADGSNRVVNIRIKEGTYNFIFEGKGTVSVDYRGGRL